MGIRIRNYILKQPDSKLTCFVTAFWWRQQLPWIRPTWSGSTTRWSLLFPWFGSTTHWALLSPPPPPPTKCHPDRLLFGGRHSMTERAVFICRENVWNTISEAVELLFLYTTLSIFWGFCQRRGRRGGGGYKEPTWASGLGYPANPRRWTNADLMLGQLRRRWTNIKSALVQFLVFSGYPTAPLSTITLFTPCSLSQETRQTHPILSLRC